MPVDHVVAAADVIVNAPSDVLRLDADPASILIPAPESIVISPSASISILAELEALLFEAAIVKTLVDAAFAVMVRLVVSVLSTESVVPSISIPAFTSTSSVPTLTSNKLLVVISISLALPCKLIPAAPSNVSPPATVDQVASIADVSVKAPLDVVTFDAAPASILTPDCVSIVRIPASISRIEPESAFALIWTDCPAV